MKPLLPHLIAGTRRIFNVAEQTTLAHYFALKCAVVDWTNGEPLISQDDRNTIAAGGLPSNLTLDLHHSADAKISPLYTQSYARIYQYGLESPNQPNVRAITIKFGRAVLFGFYSSRYGIKLRTTAVRLVPGLSGPLN